MAVKFVCPKEPIHESLNAVSKIVGSAESKVFWMQVKKDKSIEFFATDGRNFLQVTPLDKCQADSEITLCLPFAEFQTFISAATNENVMFVVEDTQIICGFKGEKGKYRFNRYDTELPKVPEVKNDKPIVINSLDFNEALEKTAFSVHPSKARAPISGVKFQVTPDFFELSSTDTGRISVFHKDFKLRRDLKVASANLPKQAIDILRTLPYGAEAEIKLNATLFSVTSGENFTFTGPQEANGDKFPDLTIFFTDTKQVSIALDCSALVAKLSLADALTRSEDRMKKALAISIEDEHFVCKLSGTKTAVEDAIKCNEIDVVDDKTETKVSFPMYRLLEAIKIYDQMELKLHLVAPPAAIKSVKSFVLIEDECWKHLILTMAD